MDWYLTAALLLLGIGAVLLAAEFFVPTGGVFVVIALTLFAAAIGGVLYYGSLTEAAALILAVCVASPIAWNLILAGYNRMAIRGATEGASGTVADTPELAEMGQLKGRFGKTLTPMRPSGRVEIDGRRVDAMSEGMVIDAGEWVKCVEARAGRVVVRKVDPPAQLHDMDLGDLG